MIQPEDIHYRSALILEETWSSAHAAPQDPVRRSRVRSACGAAGIVRTLRQSSTQKPCGRSAHCGCVACKRRQCTDQLRLRSRSPAERTSPKPLDYAGSDQNFISTTNDDLSERHHNRDDGDDDQRDVEHQRHTGCEPDVDIVDMSHRDMCDRAPRSCKRLTPVKIAAEIAELLRGLSESQHFISNHVTRAGSSPALM